MPEKPTPNELTTDIDYRFDEIIPTVDIEQIIPEIRPATSSHQDLDSAEFSEFSTPRSDTLIDCITKSDNSRKAFGNFIKQFNGQIVVDLGAGQTRNGYIIAGFAEAKAYVGVEPSMRNFENLQGNITYPGMGSYLTVDLDKPLIPASLVNQETLNFLRRLPDGSVSVLASGIDEFIVHDNPKYLREVSNEIARVLHPEGAFINWDSSFHLDTDSPEGAESFKEIKLSKEEQEEILLPSPWRLTKYVKR